MIEENANKNDACRGGNLPMKRAHRVVPRVALCVKPTGKPLCCQDETARRVSQSDARTLEEL